MEVHHDPDRALSDGAQSLYPAQYEELIQRARLVAVAVGRTL
jgi:3-deoxy-7-phosphoheptulonate synthase